MLISLLVTILIVCIVAYVVILIVQTVAATLEMPARLQQIIPAIIWCIALLVILRSALPMLGASF